MMHARNLTVAAAVLVLAGGSIIAANAETDGTDSTTGLEETTSLYAFAVQPDGCTPGYVHINAARGATWSIGGQPVDVAGPSSRFAYPEGLQDDVTATALDGYRIARNVRSTFYLTVNALPASCTTAPTSEPSTPPTAPREEPTSTPAPAPHGSGTPSTSGPTPAGEPTTEETPASDAPALETAPIPGGCVVDQ